MDWISANAEWLFSGIAISLPIAILTWWFSRKTSPSQNQVGGDGSTNIQGARDVNVKIENKE